MSENFSWHATVVQQQKRYLRWTILVRVRIWIWRRRRLVALTLSEPFAHVLDQELISYRYSYSCCCSCCWTNSSTTFKAPFSNGIGMKFGRNVLHGNTHRLMESDFWFGRWRHIIKMAATTSCLVSTIPLQFCRCRFAVPLYRCRSSVP